MINNTSVAKQSLQQYVNYFDQKSKELKDPNSKLDRDDVLLILNEALDVLDKYTQTPTKYSNSIISFVIRTIVHAFTRIIFNFKSIITSFYKDVKRSELQFFVQSYPLLVRGVEKQKYFDIVDAELPYFPFKDKIQKVNSSFADFYKKFDIKNNSKAIYDQVKSISDKIIKEEEPSKVTPDILNLQRLSMNKFCQSVMKYLLTNVIINPKSLSTTFGSVYPNMNTLITIKKTLLEYETDLYNQTSLASSILDKCDKTLTQFENKLENITPAYAVNGKTAIKKFADTLYQIAYYFESVGSYAKEVNHLSHFVVNTYRGVDNYLAKK